MRIHPIQTGSVWVKERQRHGAGPGPLRALRTMADRNWTERLPILAWLIEHPDGPIVVDTGETARVSEPGWFPRWHPYFKLAVREDVEPDDEIGPQLERLGIQARDVRRVVLTHMHTDHAGGLSHFPSAEILATRREIADAKGLLGSVRGYLPKRVPDWFAPAPVDFEPTAFGSFPQSLAIADGVTLVPTPGHTPGHLSVAVRVSDERLVFLAGDTSYTQRQMVDGVADGVTNDPATAVQTLTRVRDLAASEPTVYLPAHDPDAVRRLGELEPVP